MRRRLSFLLLRAAVAAVIALHAGLLWQRIADLSITAPLVMARWLAAALAAVAALVLLHRRVSWRAWIVFAVAVLLLHAGAPPEGLRLDVLTEAVFALAPLVLLLAGLLSARCPEMGVCFEKAGAAVLPAPFVAPLSSRAPPRR